MAASSPLHGRQRSHTASGRQNHPRQPRVTAVVISPASRQGLGGSDRPEVSGSLSHRALNPSSLGRRRTGSSHAWRPVLGRRVLRTLPCRHGSLPAAADCARAGRPGRAGSARIAGTLALAGRPHPATEKAPHGTRG